MDGPAPNPRPDGLVAGGARYPAGPPEQWPGWTAGPWPAPEAPAPPPEPRSRRTGALVAVGAALVLLLVVAAVVWGTASDDEPVADGATSSTTDPLPSLPLDPTFPTLPDLGGPGLGPADPGVDPFADSRPLDEALPELIDFVEVTRGHRFRTPPAVEPLDDAAFLDRYLAALAGSEDQVRAEGVGLRALGILTPDSDPVAVQESLGAQGVLGFYDPATEELVVRGTEVTPYVETIIVHELTHALDDQYFDLQRGEVFDQLPDERGFGLLALAEGSARRVQLAYEDQMSPTELLSAQLEALVQGLGGTSDPSAAPLPEAFQVASLIPYGNGAALVDDIVSGGGTAALDAAFRTPPATSEQVLDPAVFAAAEPTVPVPVPAASGAVADQGAFGAVDLRLLEVAADPSPLASHLDASSTLSPTVVVDPVDGFGGGSFVTWEDGGKACIRFTAVGDTPEGTRAIVDAASTWAAGIDGGATVTPQGDGVTGQRCA